jgi:small subunit ribosomal protein S2
MRHNIFNKICLNTLIKNGVHLGHHKNKGNAEAFPYIIGSRGSIHIIDLETTLISLRNALCFVNKVSANGGTVLFMSAVPDYSGIIEICAKKANQPYINKQWIGGLLTNYIQIKKRLENLSSCSYRFVMSTQGVRAMNALPDAIFILGIKNSAAALHEASLLKIPIIAIVDTNDSIQNVTYPIPGNDDSILAANLYCQLISNAILSGNHKTNI